MCWHSTQSFHLAPSQRLLLNWMNVGCSRCNCGRWLAAFATGCFSSLLSAATLCLLAFCSFRAGVSIESCGGGARQRNPVLAASPTSEFASTNIWSFRGDPDCPAVFSLTPGTYRMLITFHRHTARYRILSLLTCQLADPDFPISKS